MRHPDKKGLPRPWKTTKGKRHKVSRKFDSYENGTAIKVERDFYYLEPSELEVPAIILGLVWDRWDQGYYKFASRKWMNIEHQSGGLLCHHLCLTGTRLRPRPEITKKLIRLHKKYYDTSIDAPADLDQIIEYRKDLHEIFEGKLDCNTNYSYFEEAVYPVDVISGGGLAQTRLPGVLEYLTDESLPAKLNDLLVNTYPTGTLGHRLGPGANWKIFILGENSD